MADFKCFSRDNRAQGKPRVYFCCHPSDAEFFEEIRHDILSLCDCTIYLCDDYQAPFDEDYECSLSQMSLFVFPVTYRFLTEDTRAFRDFTWAKAHSVPVLPLMQGEGLEKLFNARCGDIQFLNKHKVDDTAISFRTKLSDFLTSTLISSEVSDKIRQAFDAYVFLSYRKKDRFHANEVMRKLHSHEFARDIAIWFDEYLVPGENFNDAIMDALLKSELFALLVTPNIVNEANYVRDVEYPEAIKAGKKVLAIEAVATDDKLLKSGFSGLTEVFSPDCPGFGEEFINSLKNLSLRQNHSPEHDFYIALAYLHGVDVEVDKPRAVEILSSCAEKGVREACSILSHCYVVGDGVTCDYALAYKYAKLALDLSTTDDERADALATLCRALILRSDIKREEKCASLRSLYGEAVAILDKSPGQNALRLMRIYCALINLSEQNEIDGLIEKATMLTTIARDKGADLDMSYACLLKSAGLRLLQSKQEKSEGLLNRALGMLTLLSDVVAEAKAHLVDLYVRMGETYVNSRQDRDALRVFDKALKLAEELALSDRLTLGLVGRIKFLKADLLFTNFDEGEEAEKLLLSSVSDFKSLSGDKGEHFLLGAVLSLDRLSYLYSTFDDTKKIDAKSEAIAILDSLSTSEELVPTSWLGEKRYELGNIYATNGMLDLALPCLEKSYEELKLGRARPSLQAECGFYLAVTHADLGDLTTAVSILEDSLAITTSACNKDEECIVWQGNILNILEKMKSCI